MFKTIILGLINLIYRSKVFQCIKMETMQFFILVKFVKLNKVELSQNNLITQELLLCDVKVVKIYILLQIIWNGLKMRKLISKIWSKEKTNLYSKFMLVENFRWIWLIKWKCEGMKQKKIKKIVNKFKKNSRFLVINFLILYNVKY